MVDIQIYSEWRRTMRKTAALLIFSLIMFSFLVACYSVDMNPENPESQNVSGIWGVFISKESTVSFRYPEKNDSICSCNKGRSSSDPDTSIELWNMTQKGLNVTATNVTTGAPVASGFWSGGMLLLKGISASWSANAVIWEKACCFEAIDTNGHRLHGIKMGGISAGCQTGMDKWETNQENALSANSSLISTKAGVIEYKILGDSGPYILAFHGGQGGYDQIKAFAPGIIGKGFRILTWSRPGYLRTPLPAVSSPQDQADAATALLDALGIDQVAAIGGSAGGPPLFYFAQRHPDRIWALIAESAVSQTYTPHSEYPYVNELVYMFTNPGGLWVFNAMFEYSTEATIRILLRTLSTQDAVSFNAWIAQIMANPDRINIIKTVILTMSPSTPRMDGTANDLAYDTQLGYLPLSEITTPTLVIHGTHDGDVDPVHAIYSKATIPGARLMWIEGGSHLLVLSDHADEVNRAELDFLNSLKP
jgi:pimeloyl-ACP methyl ester carboxylesterase